MPRHERLDFKGAIQYVRVRGPKGSTIFFDANDLKRFPEAPRRHAPHLRKFELMIAATCEEYGVMLHAYCLEPNSGILVLQTAGATLPAYMHQLCRQYSRYLRAKSIVGDHGVFGARYESKLIAPEYLPHAVRRVHRSPVDSGLCLRRLDYPFSSERAHMGEPASMPINTVALKSALELKGHFGSRGYRIFMDLDEGPHVANLLSHGSRLDSRIVGGKVFVQQARRTAAHPPAPPTRDELIVSVARLMNVAPTEIFAATPAGVLGRALVAWYGTRTGAATLTDMGRWFSVTGATLAQGFRHHRELAPELFGLPVLPGLSN